MALSLWFGLIFAIPQESLQAQYADSPDCPAFSNDDV
jgi:hypothetical protein